MEKGKCPECGSDDITYGDSELIDDSMGYRATCNKCLTEFTEWYDLVYSCTIKH